MKRLLSVLMCIVMLVPLGISVNAQENSMPIEVKAKAAVLMDQTTGRVLMKMNENELILACGLLLR